MDSHADSRNWSRLPSGPGLNDVAMIIGDELPRPAQLLDESVRGISLLMRYVDDVSRGDVVSVSINGKRRNAVVRCLFFRLGLEWQAFPAELDPQHVQQVVEQRAV